MPEYAMPFEVAEFERLLQKPNSDPTGLAGYFSAGEILLTRVPARLDVMGGIADYSGAHVCESVLGRGLAIALQPRTDRTLRIRTVQMGRRSLPVETRIPLDYFETGGRLATYAEVRELCQSTPLSSWASYIGGSIFTLLREEAVPLRYGFSLLLLSAVPMNVGIGSSATAEIATLHCLQTYLGLHLTPARLAQLGQIAENQVVGAPCGIMDQITVASGKDGGLIRARKIRAVSRARPLFETNCSACHGPDGKGNQMFGAPNLTDGIWLYGPTRADIRSQIVNGRGGVMPTWGGRLSPETIKSLAVYVHSLGGGE